MLACMSCCLGGEPMLGLCVLTPRARFHAAAVTMFEPNATTTPSCHTCRLQDERN